LGRTQPGHGNQLWLIEFGTGERKIWVDGEWVDPDDENESSRRATLEFPCCAVLCCAVCCMALCVIVHSSISMTTNIGGSSSALAARAASPGLCGH